MNHLDKPKLLEEIVTGACDRWTFRLNPIDSAEEPDPNAGFDVLHDASPEALCDALADLPAEAVTVDLRAETVREPWGVYGYERRSGCHLETFAPAACGAVEYLAVVVFEAMRDFKDEVRGVVVRQ